MFTWLDERFRIKVITDFLSRKSIPQHKHSFWYYFGGLTLFFFIVQLVTGVLLLFYYKPTIAEAYKSVEHIVNEVPYGWLIRSAHSWSANLMIGCMLIHMFSAFFMKAYRKPREMMWITGVVLFLLVLGFGFTGYLLPWNEVAYFATQIGTEIPEQIPIVGEWVVKILRGGTEVNGETLTRMFAIHVVILPLFALGSVVVHIIMNLVLGTSTPIRLKLKKPNIPFFNNFILRDATAWLTGLAILVALCFFIPWELGVPYDFERGGAAPVGIRPEWYFMFLFQSLQLAHPIVIFSLLTVVGIFWILIPFLDKRASREQKSHVFTIIGLLAISYLVGMTIWAYISVSNQKVALGSQDAAQIVNETIKDEFWKFWLSLGLIIICIILFIFKIRQLDRIRNIR
jgi:cytochrome b6